MTRHIARPAVVIGGAGFIAGRALVTVERGVITSGSDFSGIAGVFLVDGGAAGCTLCHRGPGSVPPDFRPMFIATIMSSTPATPPKIHFGKGGTGGLRTGVSIAAAATADSGAAGETGRASAAAISSSVHRPRGS